MIDEGLVSHAVFRTLDDATRRDLARALAERLGPEFAPAADLRGRARLAAVLHRPTGLELVAVPGATFVSGLRPEEVRVVRGLDHVEGDDTVEQIDDNEKAQKPRVATVAPFLCARTPILRDRARAMLGDDEVGWVVGDEDDANAVVLFDKDDCARLLVGGPFRLLRRAEWELVARAGGDLAFVNGATPEEAAAACEALYDRAYDPGRDDAGTNALGIWGLPWGDWVGDDKRPSAPSAIRAGAAASYPWQNDEIVGALCGWGDDGCGMDQAAVRFALDLPGASAKVAAKTRAAAEAPKAATASGVAMMAIVAKAAFEKEAGGARPGALWATDRYRAGSKALAPLAGGGTLYLVTVRPPDERLWLVAVLRGVDERDGAWVAPTPNAVPVADVSALRPTLRFTTGKGVSQEPGALGMSLQTPRALAPEDVAALAPFAQRG